MSIRSVIEIRYAQIRSLDLSNGEGIGVALFVQGCHFHCPNCFNPKTWDFNSGKEWTEEVKNKFMELANHPYIKRISILGGEPLAEENLDDVLDLVNRIRLSSPQKSIWIYTGYTFEECYTRIFPEYFLRDEKPINGSPNQNKRKKIIKNVDIMVDGQYIDSQRDITLHYRGSKNQRIIDIQKSLQRGEVVLWK